MQQTPWAILLTKWSDHPEEPRSQTFFEELFTEVGSGTYNMTDYFWTMSHEDLDLSGSHVFGWLTLDLPQTAYAGNVGTPPPGQINRIGLLSRAKSTAVANGVDLSQYWGVVVVMNTPTDLFGVLGGRAALCDLNSLQPTVLGQEMGHGYGLMHSRLDGSQGDYQDPWDTMSTWDSCYFSSSSSYELIGPGLNAANMRYMGWLNESRVWKASGPAFEQQIELRPLHRLDLPGFLAAELPGTPGGFLVEFRVAEDWDEAFPRSAVFVHRLEGGHSYRMIGTAGNSDLVAGESFRSGSGLPWLPETTLTVEEIDESRHYAKISVGHRPGIMFPFELLGGRIYGGVAVDGPGGIIIGGVPHPIDPWGPFQAILSQMVSYRATEEIADPIVRIQARRSILQSISDHLGGALAELTELETPPSPAKGWGPGGRQLGRRDATGGGEPEPEE